MTRRHSSRGAQARVVGVGAVLGVACSSPELGDTRFACATDGDCAPGQVCAPFQGLLACQRTPATAVDPCQGGSCGARLPAASDAQPQREAPFAAGAPATPACSEGTCASAGAPLSGSEPPGTSLADAGASAGGEPPPDVGVATPPDAGLRDAGGAVAVPEGPRIRVDFESSLEGWQSVRDQRPDDTLDGTQRSTVLAHHGSSALRMVYDGRYTPEFGVTASNGFYGAFQQGAPPPGAEVSLWMLSTAPNVSVEVYWQAGPSSARTILATAPLLEDQWREIRFDMPFVQAQQFGVRVLAALDLDGFVYLDEISW